MDAAARGGAAADVEGGAREGGGAGDAAEDAGDQVGDGQREDLLALVELGVRQLVRKPAIRRSIAPVYRRGWVVAYFAEMTTWRTATKAKEIELRKRA